MIGSIQGKVWGKTRQIFGENNVEIHNIEIKKGGFCSKHKHHHKYNAFYCVSGKLKVKVWKNDYDLVDETVLFPGESMTVPPGEYHMFEAIEKTSALEIYWITLDPKDIERETSGGTR